MCGQATRDLEFEMGFEGDFAGLIWLVNIFAWVLQSVIYIYIYIYICVYIYIELLDIIL